MRAARFVSALVLVAATCGAGLAAAQTVDLESEHQLGMQLRARGHDAEAAVVFRTLFERTGEPRALARLGLAEGALLRWSEAEEHLEGALARRADPWVAANRANLESALLAVRQHLGFVMVRSATPGATVTWSGQVALPIPLPRPLRVATGFLDVTVSAPGYTPATRRVAITAGADPVVVDVDLSRVVPTTEVPRETHVVAPIAAPVAAREVNPVNTTPQRPWQRPLAIGLLAGAGVAIGVGVAGVVVRQGAASRFNSSGCRLYPDRDELSVGGSDCASELSSAQTGVGLSIGGFVASGVLAIAGVTTLLLAPRRVRERARVLIGPAAVGRGVHLGVGWTF